MLKKDFSRRRYFPGTHHNPFDRLLRLIDAIQNIPALIFAALLFGLALLPRLALSFPLSLSLILWGFFLGDWALLAALPRAGKSFGPPKPPTLMLAVLRLIPAMFPLPLMLAAQLLGIALVIYGFWIEPQRLTLTRQFLRTPKLKLERPLRLLHLGDLHMERITERDRKMVALTRELAPDVILFSGDFLNLSCLHDPEAWEAARTILRELHAPLGVFVVTGSPAVDRDDVVPQLLNGLTHLRWLRDEKITLHFQGQPIDIVGLTCSHKPFVDGPRLRSIITPSPALPHVSEMGEGASGGRFTILLYHSPDLAPDAAEAGIDLQLSGHTHGGQVRLPLYGALFAGSLYGKRFEAGRRQVGPMTLYVTRGLGLEGKGAPRVRCLCPPEMILWEIDGP